jgi:hypothetical protein
MTAEVRDDGGPNGLTRGMGFGRGGGLDSLAARREAAQRRVSSSLRAAELVDCGLRRFDEALADHGDVDHDGALRPTVRALLGLAYATVDYDMTIVPASGDVAVRVRYTTFGPEAEVVELSLEAEAPAPSVAPAPPMLEELIAVPARTPLATTAPGVQTMPTTQEPSRTQEPSTVHEDLTAHESLTVYESPAEQDSPSTQEFLTLQASPAASDASAIGGAADHGPVMEAAGRATARPASPWWTPETHSR